ncbi:MAG: glycosyltransferase family 2 protein [Oscillospiraceae bacterium]
MSKVSIILPIYNIDKYLARCLNSIINQTYSNIEIILVNDGSTDNSAEICKEYKTKDERILFFDNTNKGCSYSRNFGLENSTGEYILFVDSDDYIALDLVEKVLKEAEENECDMVVFDLMSIDEENNRSTVISSAIPVGKTFSIDDFPALLNISPSPVNKLVSRRLWIDSEIRFPVGRRYEDLEAISKLFAVAKRVRYYNEKPLYFYAFRNDSFVKSGFNKNKFEEIVIAIDNVSEYFKAKNLYIKLADEFEFYYIMHCYFYPSKELIIQRKIDDLLCNIRSNIDDKFPNFESNKYLSTLSKSDRIMFKLLVKKNYSLMNWLSSIRNIIAKLLKK